MTPVKPQLPTTPALPQPAPRTHARVHVRGVPVWSGTTLAALAQLAIGHRKNGNSHHASENNTEK